MCSVCTRVCTRAFLMQDVRELIEYPLTHPEIYTHLRVDPPRGILLHGPPGTTNVDTTMW